jgi:hypothetical protein
MEQGLLGGIADCRSRAGKVQDEPGYNLLCQKVRKWSEKDEEARLKDFHWPNLGQFEHKNKY